MEESAAISDRILTDSWWKGDRQRLPRTVAGMGLSVETKGALCVRRSPRWPRRNRESLGSMLRYPWRMGSWPGRILRRSRRPLVMQRDSIPRRTVNLIRAFHLINPNYAWRRGTAMAGACCSTRARHQPRSLRLLLSLSRSLSRSF